MVHFARRRTSALAEGLFVAVLVGMLAGLAGLTGFASAAPGGKPTLPAATPAMSIAPGSGAPGLDIEVTGSAFPRRVAVQLTWDGDPTGMPTVLTSRSGGFRVVIVVPDAPPGPHSVQAVRAPDTAKGTSTGTTGPLAWVSFMVNGAATPSPTPSATPTASPTPVATPTPSASPAPTPTPSPTASPGGPSISGNVYQDIDRDGVRDPGELPLAGQGIELRDTSARLIGSRTTDASGAYAFTGLTAGTYQVLYDDDAWRALRLDWVPTTTGGLAPRVTAVVQRATVVDFGWRPMIRSTQLLAPIATYTGPSGLRVETYNDAVPPLEIYREIMLGLVGPEAGFVTVRFDFNQNAQTSAGWQGIPGTYSNYAAIIYAGYDFWLDGGDQGLSHEYGHAWSYYYARIVQQEPGFEGYLGARGLTGDPRVGTTYAWYPAEMIAEDYRELFGSDNAKLAWHLNGDIPAPEDVAGLRDWFLDTFVAAPPD